MDQTLIAAIRKNLEAKSTAELRQAYESGDKAARSPEELEAIRQVLQERRNRGNRVIVALATAMLLGAIGAGFAWWQDCSGELVLLAGVGCAVLGFASFYVRDLFPFVRI
jgi:hypothetical protein